jgi:hypothetical protein
MRGRPSFPAALPSSATAEDATCRRRTRSNRRRGRGHVWSRAPRRDDPRDRQSGDVLLPASVRRRRTGGRDCRVPSRPASARGRSSASRSGTRSRPRRRCSPPTTRSRPRRTSPSCRTPTTRRCRAATWSGNCLISPPSSARRAERDRGTEDEPWNLGAFVCGGAVCASWIVALDSSGALLSVTSASAPIR